jgi:hypothetical protein
MPVFIPSREFQILIRRLSRLLDESMQQNHSTLRVYVKKNPGDAVLAEACADFVDGVAQWPACGHPDGPAELHSFNVFSDALSILGQGQPLQPMPNGFSAGASSKEDRRNPFLISLNRLGLRTRVDWKSGLLTHG